MSFILCYRMPWQGNKDILIDRFDVRAHLDYIAEVTNNDDEHTYPEVSDV